MVRQIIFPTSNKFMLNLPDELLGKEVEILAFELKEETILPRDQMDNERTIKSKREVDSIRKELDEFYDNFHFDFSNHKFNRDEANER